MLWLHIKVISSVIYGAASLSKRGPIMSRPVALLISILERNLKTFSFWIGGIINFVSCEILSSQNSRNLSCFDLVKGSFSLDAILTKKLLNSFAISVESSVCVSPTLIDVIVDCLCLPLPAPTSKKILVNPLLTSTPCVDQPPDPIEQEIPDLYPSCAVTRAMAKKAKLYDGMQDINLTDTLIGQSFNKEISTSLSPSQSDIQTDPSNPRSGSENDLSPSTSNDQGHDQMSRSQLCKEQHSDSDISPLFERAFNENEISQVPVCYYVKNGILMRKWRPPDVSAEDEWTVNHQIVIPRVYRPEILNLAHETPMSGHLGVNKTYLKILNHFYWPGIKSDVSQHCKSCHTCQMVGKPNQTIPKAQLQRL